jgi:regulator of protease activity HflC (stomatin/prohibitin superfamily)
MNAIDTVSSIPVRHDFLQRPAFTAAARWVRLLPWLTAASATAAAALTGLWLVTQRMPPFGIPAAVHRTPLVIVLVASLLLPCAGFLLTWLISTARRNAGLSPLPPRRWRFPPRMRRGDPRLPGESARWPQAIGAGVVATAAVAAGLVLQPMPGVGVPPQTDILVGALALVLAFPLLLTERWLAAVPDSRLPEAGGLRRLMLIPTLAWPIAGLAQIADALGVPVSPWIDRALLVFIGATGTELILRALARCFLPPPQPWDAIAAVDSLLARFLADGLCTRSFSAPVRDHLGIDFSRSWALAYLRAATPPVVLLLMLVSWGLSGVVMVGIDQRAVYERFGAPVAVLHPGAHLILPWPMGRVLRLDYGVIYETTLSDAIMIQPTMRTGAEDTPPRDADRLWEQAHPGELDFLIASGDALKQSFQVVSADIKLRYRIGLTDDDALRAAFSVADPLAILRGTASRAVARFFASQTLDAVLGESREAIAGRLHTDLQQALNRIGSGLDVAAVTIEAIHPPAGAAEAYHEVQAAQIRAQTMISAERGRAASNLSKAQQYARQITDEAHAAAAEAVGMARSDTIRFDADLAADRANPASFLLERRLTALSQSLTKVPLTIIDHRIPADKAPMLDLRPLSPATVRGTPAD